ncbi:MAG TPA: leucine zipper domain-containing protein, partial [Candidatus Bathyarchaeia archaeon]
MPEVARDAGVPLRSVQRWLARYRATGLAGLVRATRSDTGHRKLPAELVEVIE